MQEVLVSRLTSVARILRSSTPGFFTCRFLALAIALACVAGQQLPAEVRIPPVPPNNYFVADYANVLEPEAFTRLGQAQKPAFEQHGTPIIVAVIWRRADYGGGHLSIEDFARQWFNLWRIGTMDAGAAGANKGILLLVCVGDRQARIELGAQWDARWNAECDRIMREDIIPEFKQGRYAEGICQGTEALARLAASDPAGPPPAALLGQLPNVANQYVREPLKQNGNPWGWGWSLLLILGGAVVLVVGLVRQEKFLIWLGFIALLTGISWVALAVLVGAMVKSQGGSRSGGSFGGYSGGGGFSRGGGASGSW